MLDICQNVLLKQIAYLEGKCAWLIARLEDELLRETKNNYKKQAADNIIEEIRHIASDPTEKYINNVFLAILGRSQNQNDLVFYRKIYDKYGSNRVVRDVLLSSEGAKNLRIPFALRILLRYFWTPSNRNID